MTKKFLLDREGDLEVYYAPFHGIKPNAKIVIVGITPGITQMLAAFKTAKGLLGTRRSQRDIFKEIKRQSAYKGPMRQNLVKWLDRIGAHKKFNLKTTNTLFNDAADPLHV